MRRALGAPSIPWPIIFIYRFNQGRLNKWHEKRGPRPPMPGKSI
jgi:hypothetical protein